MLAVHFNLDCRTMTQLTLLKSDSGSEGEKEVRIIDDAAVEWQTIGHLIQVGINYLQLNMERVKKRLLLKFLGSGCEEMVNTNLQQGQI